MAFLKKIIFFISITLWPQLGFTEGDGLPQMDFTTFPSQVFWLIVTFGILYLFMWRTAIPKLRNTIEERQDKISLDINEAEKVNTEAENTLMEYKEKMQSVSLEANEIINHAKINSDKMIEIFKGKDDDFSKAVCLNAAAGLIVGEKFSDFSEAYNHTREFILSGKTFLHLEKIQNV